MPHVVYYNMMRRRSAARIPAVATAAHHLKLKLFLYSVRGIDRPAMNGMFLTVFAAV